MADLMADLELEMARRFLGAEQRGLVGKTLSAVTTEIRRANSHLNHDKLLKALQAAQNELGSRYFLQESRSHAKVFQLRAEPGPPPQQQLDAAAHANIELQGANAELQRQLSTTEQQNTELQQQTTELQRQTTELQRQNMELQQRLELQQQNADAASRRAQFAEGQLLMTQQMLQQAFADLRAVDRGLALVDVKEARETGRSDIKEAASFARSNFKEAAQQAREDRARATPPSMPPSAPPSMPPSAPPSVAPAPPPSVAPAPPPAPPSAPPSAPPYAAEATKVPEPAADKGPAPFCGGQRAQPPRAPLQPIARQVPASAASPSVTGSEAYSTKRAECQARGLPPPTPTSPETDALLQEFLG